RASPAMARPCDRRAADSAAVCRGDRCSRERSAAASNGVPFILLLHARILRLLVARYNLDCSFLGIDLHSGYSHASPGRSLNRAGYVALTEYGGATAHFPWLVAHRKSSKLSPGGPSAGHRSGSTSRVRARDRKSGIGPGSLKSVSELSPVDPSTAL